MTPPTTTDPTATEPRYQIETRNPLAGLAIGRIVHYVLDGTPARPETRGHVRPAIVVNVFDHQTGLANLTVFADGSNDGLELLHRVLSRPFNEAHEPGTWHWPERVAIAPPALAFNALETIQAPGPVTVAAPEEVL
jgi:hypothetical protein